jgi:alanyl-tRNA synthetase
MKAEQIRETFLKFFEGKGHKRLPSSSLLPENDPTVLFTTAGMQQFKRFYLFPDEAPQVRITTCQKCVRTGDIHEVGDETHLTFFEMLGNFTFGYPQTEGSYFKNEAIAWAWEFLTSELGIDKERVYATYFKGENGVPADIESLEILKTIDGLKDIRQQGFEDNFWSLGSEGSPGGPTVEFYVYPESNRGVDGVEVWNLVFNEFVLKDGKYEPSELKGVDTGMGLERLAAVIQKKTSVYEIDFFAPVMLDLKHIMRHTNDINSESEARIIADHMRTASFMAIDGVVPSNKNQGYVLRRLIRRALFYSNMYNQAPVWGIVNNIIQPYPELKEKERHLIATVLGQEWERFALTIYKGKKEIEKLNVLNAKSIFDLYQTYGYPPELSIEYARTKGIEISSEDLQSEIKKHQKLSRTASVGMFKGGLADNKIETTRLHTAAHLLLAALRHELGDEIEQKGSNITEERLRFDFNYPEKLTDEQKQKIEDLVNSKIEEALPVTMQQMSLEEAKSSGATGSFHDKYGDIVKIFTIGPMEEPFSREICGGPHVQNTSELGHFRVTKEESSSSGVRRIKAVLE